MIDTQAIIDVVAREAALDPAELTEATVLKDLKITSLDMMNVLFSIEDVAGVIVEPDDLTGVETLGDLIRVVEGKLSLKPEGDVA